jgi:hypothetical protein
MESYLYTSEQFKQTFLNIDFDNFFIENNNNIINSNDLYLQYKSEYLKKTSDNLEKYTQLFKTFNQLSSNYNIVNNNKYSYTFIDKNEYKKTNKILKELLLEQRQLYNNFMTYVQFLNFK